MIEGKGNLFFPEDVTINSKKLNHVDAICITTNGFVKKDNRAVMGRGVANVAKNIYPNIDLTLGTLIKKGGNVPQLIEKDNRGFWVVSFPVKPDKAKVARDKSNIVDHMKNVSEPGQSVPGWMSVADIGIIEKSSIILSEIATIQGWNCIILPMPGCLNGQLSWSVVKPIMQQHLDNRFIVITDVVK